MDAALFLMLMVIATVASAPLGYVRVANRADQPRRS